MQSVHSARGSMPEDASAASGFGLAEFGAPWGRCDRVLIAVHGRDRDANELPNGFAARSGCKTTRVLAPYARGKNWYEGRYDAPFAENADAVKAGLEWIDTAFERAAENAFPASKVVLAGFSQGGCMVAEYLLGGAHRPAAAAIFTGSVLDIAHRRASAKLEGMPVLLSGGAGDPWLPMDDLRATGALLEAAGANVELHMFSDGDHVVRDQEMSLLGQLVKGVAA
ncbi:dienelactone hydrolase family protein [Pelagibacterium sp. H642]|uniref:alpha/beta hydrolase n=1 Tax=Pelagibacterium sp. H642 TaxID=1881069 RepID=UPI002815BA65|nr:dienelactone hydrolase family protein [Pelagibacterium sp. H642]WMT91038.1 dienelactone hydrolase family protein [Pelagibacterium sp. H642]